MLRWRRARARRPSPARDSDHPEHQYHQHDNDGDGDHEEQEQEQEEEEEVGASWPAIQLRRTGRSAHPGMPERLGASPDLRHDGATPGTKLTIQLGLGPEEACSGIYPGMELTMGTEQPEAKRGVRSDRRIPGWAAGLLARLARDCPTVVSREDIEADLKESGSSRQVDPTVRELQRLGWLKPLHVKGVWAYVPPGEEEVIDPYIDLRGWKAREPDATFALAGEAAAWHLGYLDRAFSGPVAVWTPTKSRLPHGLRAHLSIVTLGWRIDDAPRLGPTTALLHRRRLDTQTWTGGLPGLGSEALIVQLSARPMSFRVWGDLVRHLEQLAEDCDEERLVGLLGKQSSSAWQRAAYLLHCGNRHDDGVALLKRRPMTNMPKVQFGEGPKTVWAPEFSVVDRLIAPSQDAGGKA